MSKNSSRPRSGLALIGYFLLTAIYCVSLTEGILSITILAHTVVQVAVISILSLIIWFVITYNKYTVFASIGLLAAAALILFLYYLYGQASPEFFESIRQHGYNLNELILGRKVDEFYHLLLIAALCLGIALYATIFTRKFFSFPALFVPGIAVFIADLFFMKFKNPLIYFAFVFCIASLFAIRSETKWKLRKSQNHLFGKYTFSVLPVCLAAVLFASFAANIFDKEPILTKAKLSEKTINRFEQIRQIYFPPSSNISSLALFNFNSTGFNPNNAQLGGNITVDDTPVLNVTINTGKEDPKYYLKGSTKDVYTGTAWQNSNDTFEAYADGTATTTIRNRSPYYSLEEIIIYDPQAVELHNYYNYMENESIIDIWPLNTPLNTLFFPLTNRTNIDITGQQATAEINDNGDIRIEPAVGVGERYGTSVTHYDKNTEYYNQAYIGYFREHEDKVINGYRHELSYSDYMGYDGYDYVDYKIGEDGVQDFYTYLDELYKKYTALPDSVPERVSNLAYSITADCETDYQRLKALEDYLREIPYSVSPGSAPAGTDFVDYFLFDSREGYCTYYASAMCVMARALGYPARFVQGYVTPEPTDETKQTYKYFVYSNDGGYIATTELIDGNYSSIYEAYDYNYIITNAQAHAWPEIYLEGIGWVQFEPTAPYSALYYKDGKSFTATTAMKEDENYQKHIDKIGAGETEVEFKDPEPIIEETNLTFAALTMTIAIIALGVLILILIIYRYRRREKYMLTLKKSGDIDLSVRGYYNEIYTLLAIDGNEKLPHETPYQFAERISENYSDITDLHESTSLYYKACYSQNQTSLSDRRKLFKNFLLLNRHMKQKLGKYRYSFKYWLKKTEKP